MVIGVVGPAAVLLDDEAFSAARSAGYFPIDVIFPIAAMRQSSFPIPEFVSSNVTGESGSIASLERREQIIDFLRCRARDVVLRNRRGLVRCDHGLAVCDSQLDRVGAALRTTSARRRQAEDREQKHAILDGTRHFINGLRRELRVRKR